MREYYTRDEVRDAALVGVQAAIKEIAGPILDWVLRVAREERANLNSDDMESLTKITSDGSIRMSETLTAHLIQIGKSPDPTLSIEEIIDGAKENSVKFLSNQ